MRWGRAVVLVALMVWGPGAGVGAPARADEPELWLEVDAPSEGEVVRLPVALVELRGRVGQGERGLYDVVVALDRSQSTLLPTGIDLDGDGVVGELRGGRDRDVYRGAYERWTTDPGDLVIEGELRAARRLLEGLHPRARVAVMRYSGEARVLAPLGPVPDAVAALDAWVTRKDGTGSSPASAVIESLDVFEGADPSTPGRPRAVFLLASDGLATASMQSRRGPVARTARQEERLADREARRAAEKARDAGVVLYVFEIQNQENEDPGLLADMAETTRGRYVYVSEPDALRFALPNPSFASVSSVTIENRTLAEPARAVRLFPNGSFDAFVPLGPGENEVGVRAELPDGRVLELVRRLRYAEPERAYPSDTVRMQALLDELRRRTVETQALPPAGPAGSDPRGRAVRVRVGDADAAEDSPEPAERAQPGEPAPRSD